MSDKPSYEELELSTQELEKKAIERKRTEQLLRQSAVLDAINRIFREMLTCETVEKVARTSLSVAEELTGSEFGFIGEVNQAGRFDTIALSNPGWDACTMPKSDAVVMIKDMEIRGIWGSVIKDERALIVNDPASYHDSVGPPEGHPTLTSFLGVPLKHGDRTVGMIALANKASGYSTFDQEDVETLSIALMAALNRKRSDETLRESEERYRTLFEDSRDAIYITTREGKFIDANQSAFDLLGYSKEEMVALNARQLYISPTTGARFQKEIEEKGFVRDYEVKLRKKDGTEIDCLFNISVRRARDGSILAYQGIIRDITERKQAEARIEHLNAVLLAIRNVNQLIAREKDRDKLLKEVCENIIGTRGYYNSWTVLLDKSEGLVTTAEAGLGKDFLPMVERLKRGELTECAKRALAKPDVVVIKDPSATCLDCPLAGDYYDRGAMTIRLEHGGKVYGLLSASVPRGFVSDAEEQSLFKELAGDIGFALHSIELEEERRRAEEALKENEAQKKAILDGSIDRIRLVDKDLRIIWANETASRELNVAAEDLAGKYCYEVLAGRETPCVGCPTIKALKSGKPERVFIHKTESKTVKGEAYWDSYAVPVKNESGEIVNIIQMVRNITKQKQAEEALRESEQIYRTLVESSTDAILMMDKARNVVTCNQGFLNLFGYKKREIEGKSIRLIHQSDESFHSFDKTAYPVINRTGSFRTEWEFMHKDGTIFPVETVTSAIRSPDGSIASYIASIRDITERKKAEKEKTELETQLLQSEKMASVGQLAAGVAHEINNPTGFVSSNLKTLSDYQNDMFSLIREYRKLVSDLRANLGNAEALDPLTEQAKRIGALEYEVDIDFILDDTPNLIKDCREGTERIKKIVIALKDFAHPGEQEIKCADINKSLDSTLNVVWNDLKYKATVTKDYGDLPGVQCYPQELNQVFMNVLVNAAQAIEDKGEIKIVTQALDGQVEIRISDTGSGIPKEHLSRIFEPFFTTKEIGKGTGLGLHVAYDIVKKHKGTIDVDSEVGKGTTFRIRIPVN